MSAKRTKGSRIWVMVCIEAGNEKIIRASTGAAELALIAPIGTYVPQSALLSGS